MGGWMDGWRDGEMERWRCCSAEIQSYTEKGKRASERQRLQEPHGRGTSASSNWIVNLSIMPPLREVLPYQPFLGSQVWAPRMSTSRQKWRYRQKQRQRLRPGFALRLSFVRPQHTRICQYCSIWFHRAGTSFGVHWFLALFSNSDRPSHHEAQGCHGIRKQNSQGSRTCSGERRTQHDQMQARVVLLGLQEESFLATENAGSATRQKAGSRECSTW